MCRRLWGIQDRYRPYRGTVGPFQLQGQAGEKERFPDQCVQSCQVFDEDQARPKEDEVVLELSGTHRVCRYYVEADAFQAPSGQLKCRLWRKHWKAIEVAILAPVSGPSRVEEDELAAGDLFSMERHDLRPDDRALLIGYVYDTTPAHETGSVELVQRLSRREHVGRRIYVSARVGAHANQLLRETVPFDGVRLIEKRWFCAWIDGHVRRDRMGEVDYHHDRSILGHHRGNTTSLKRVLTVLRRGSVRRLAPDPRRHHPAGWRNYHRREIGKEDGLVGPVVRPQTEK